MPSAEPVRVTIFNQTYTLVAQEDASDVLQLAQTVDDLMNSIAANAGNLDSARIAVLACLHLADRLRTVQRELDTLKSSVETKAKAFAHLLDGAISE